jgi:hypothetical protein
MNVLARCRGTPVSETMLAHALVLVRVAAAARRLRHLAVLSARFLPAAARPPRSGDELTAFSTAGDSS